MSTTAAPAVPRPRRRRPARGGRRFTASDADRSAFPRSRSSSHFRRRLLAKRLAPYAAEDELLKYLGQTQPPLTAHHLLGTDAISHDFLSQLLVAIHETTISSLTCAGLTTVAGTVVGALAGY